MTTWSPHSCNSHVGDRSFFNTLFLFFFFLNNTVVEKYHEPDDFWLSKTSSVLGFFIPLHPSTQVDRQTHTPNTFEVKKSRVIKPRESEVTVVFSPYYLFSAMLPTQTKFRIERCMPFSTTSTTTTTPFPHPSPSFLHGSPVLYIVYHSQSSARLSWYISLPYYICLWG